jgi:acyl carrier protein
MNRGMGSGSGEKTLTTDASAVVLEIVSEMSGVTDLGPHSELVADLGFDSLGLVELLAVLEDALGLSPIDVEALGEIDRVADLQRVVREAAARTPPSARTAK